MSKTYYRTPYSVTILSEEPIPEGMDFESVMQEADTGSYVADVTDRPSEEIGEEEMAKALTAAGSDPSFFDIEQ